MDSFSITEHDSPASGFYDLQHYHPNSDASNSISSSSNRSSLPPASGTTVSATSTARMTRYGIAAVPQQTRHARRIYVGGIPPSFIDEDGLRAFMNSVIAQGLGEENDHSYVLSVYINQKKCFAFVELKSIELATACLELDGICLKNVVLRILRANEYKPELVPQAMNKTIRFDLSGFQFGSIAANTSSHWANMESVNSTSNWTGGEEMFVERTLDSIIQFTNLSGLEQGAVIIVGYPYDESTSMKKAASAALASSSANTSINPNSSSSNLSLSNVSASASTTATSTSNSLRGQGCQNAPKIFRNNLRKFKYGYVDNPEYDVDLAKLKILDVGDVVAGKSADETRANLTRTITELLVRGGIPFVIGGSLDTTYHSSVSLISLTGTKTAVVYISAHGDIKVLDDTRFMGTRTPSPFPLSCQGRYIVFGAQGAEYSKDEVAFVKEHGGKFIWYNKDIKNSSSHLTVPEMFGEVLKDLNRREEGPLTIVVNIDAGALNAYSAPCANNSNSPQGFHLEDLIEIMRIAGTEPTVSLINVTEFSPEPEESRANLILVELFYYFMIGIAQRRSITLPSNANPIATTSIQKIGSPSVNIRHTLDPISHSTSVVPQNLAFPNTLNTSNSTLNNNSNATSSSINAINANSNSVNNNNSNSNIPGNNALANALGNNVVSGAIPGLSSTNLHPLRQSARSTNEVLQSFLLSNGPNVSNAPVNSYANIGVMSSVGLSGIATNPVLSTGLTLDTGNKSVLLGSLNDLVLSPSRTTTLVPGTARSSVSSMATTTSNQTLDRVNFRSPYSSAPQTPHSSTVTPTHRMTNPLALHHQTSSFASATSTLASRSQSFPHATNTLHSQAKSKKGLHSDFLSQSLTDINDIDIHDFDESLDLGLGGEASTATSAAATPSAAGHSKHLQQTMKYAGSTTASNLAQKYSALSNPASNNNLSTASIDTNVMGYGRSMSYSSLASLPDVSNNLGGNSNNSSLPNNNTSGKLGVDYQDS